MAQLIMAVGGEKLVAHGSGSSSAISKSNSRNKIATRKNRGENGRRAVPCGSNPHSYGDSFSELRYGIGSQKARMISTSEMDSDSVAMSKITITLS